MSAVPSELYISEYRGFASTGLVSPPGTQAWKTGLMTKVSEEQRPEPLLYSVPDVAHVLAIGRTKVYELAASRELPSVKIDGRRLFLVADVHEYVDRLGACSGDRPSPELSNSPAR